VALHPPDFWQREPGERRIGGQFNESLRTNLLGYLPAFFSRALIAPEYRGPQHFVLSIQEHQAMHLAGQAYGSNFLTGDGAFRKALLDGLARGTPPIFWGLFRPPNVRGTHGGMLGRGRA
jgi:hypothetical protein